MNNATSKFARGLALAAQMIPFAAILIGLFVYRWLQDWIAADGEPLYSPPESTAPTLLLFALASLAVTLPTFLVGLARFRTDRAGRELVTGLAFLPCVSLAAVLVTALATLGDSRALAGETISHPITIGSHVVPRGSIVGRRGAWYRVTLPAEQTYAGVPLSGPFWLRSNGEFPPLDMTLARDATIGDVRCAAGPIVFVRFELSSCEQLATARVDGVPCDTASESFGDRGLSGGRVDCDLAERYSRYGIRWPAGTHAELTSDTMRIGPSGVPGLRFRGRPLSGQIWLTFLGDHITILDLDRRTNVCVSRSDRGCGGDERANPSDLTFDGRPVLR